MAIGSEVDITSFKAIKKYRYGIQKIVSKHYVKSALNLHVFNNLLIVQGNLTQP